MKSYCDIKFFKNRILNVKVFKQNVCPSGYQTSLSWFAGPSMAYLSIHISSATMNNSKDMLELLLFALILFSSFSQALTSLL